MESTLIVIGILALCMFVYMTFDKGWTELNSTQIPYNAPETTPMYFPKWRKLKYWQPTKKNPKRR